MSPKSTRLFTLCRLVWHIKVFDWLIVQYLIPPIFALEIRKVLSKLSKEKCCESIAEWIRPCENHLYWSATTTFSGNGMVIWAKFRSFMNHIVNKHSNLSDALFNKCYHDAIKPRKWLKVGMYCCIIHWLVQAWGCRCWHCIQSKKECKQEFIHSSLFSLSLGSVAYEKLCSALNNSHLVKGIKQASPFAQTSCLEGFHSVLNHFAPKMIAFSYAGMYCRCELSLIL